MSRRYLRSIPFLPYAVTFTDMERPDGTQFDVGDKNEAVDAMESSLRADAALLHLLRRMNDREKIILMFQVLREAGYNLNHADCAKTLTLTRERYMVLVKGVRKKAGKILQMTIE